MPYNPSAFAAAIKPEPPPSSDRADRQLADFNQLIDAKEVMRLLAFHLAAMPPMAEEQQRTYCRAVLAHIHHGGLLKNTGRISSQGAIAPLEIGDGLSVRSLWVLSARDANGQYWRAYYRQGYRQISFEHFPESKLALEEIRAHVLRHDSELLGFQGAEYADVCYEILRNGAHGTPLLLSTSRAALSLADEISCAHQLKLRANAGQRVMGVKQAFGWLSGKLEKASAVKRNMFEDLQIAAFYERPGEYLGRWDLISEKGGTARYKAKLSEHGGSHPPLPAYDISKSRQCDRFPADGVASIAGQARALLSAPCKQPTADELAKLGGYIVGTGYGLPIQPARLPVSVGLVET